MEELWKAMCVIDPDTCKSRGYFTLSSFKYSNHENISMDGLERLAMSCPPIVRSWNSVTSKKRVTLPPCQRLELEPQQRHVGISEEHPRQDTAAS